MKEAAAEGWHLGVAGGWLLVAETGLRGGVAETGLRWEAAAGPTLVGVVGRCLSG